MTRALLAAAALAACAPRESLVARDGFAYAPPTPTEAAAYVTLVNRGTAPDTLLGVSSPVAASAGVHRQAAAGDGYVRMEAVTALPIAPGDSVVMAPGGLHIMLMALSAPLEPGDSLPLELRLARAGALAVTVPVRAYGDEP